MMQQLDFIFCKHDGSRCTYPGRKKTLLWRKVNIFSGLKGFEASFIQQERKKGDGEHWPALRAASWQVRLCIFTAEYFCLGFF